MQTSDRGKAFIKGFESLELTAYPDPGTGGKPYTVGYGHVGPAIGPGTSITRERAEEFFEDDVRKAEICVTEAVDVTLTQGQFDALVSFVFNVGCAAFRKSTLLRLLNSGQEDAAAQQFGRWVNAGGKPMAGLRRRREAERKMFMEGV